MKTSYHNCPFACQRPGMRHRPYSLCGPRAGPSPPLHAGSSLVPSHNRGGWRAEKAQPELSTHLLAGGAAPFGAPPGLSSGFICGVFTAEPGRALPTERFARSPAAISRRLLGQPFLRSLGLCLASAVSQLLAGPRNGAGRCPGTARVRGYEPRPRAPHSRRAFTHPARNTPMAVLRHNPHPACSIIETSRDDALS